VNPLVSVILPVHNGGRFLAPAVDSILAQTLTDFELLLVDDASTDGAVQALPRNDQRLRILSSPSRGVVHAFNAGMKSARGDLVARMDADDMALPGRLAAQADLLLQDQRLGIAGACIEFIAEGGVRGGNRHYRDWLNSLRSPEAIRRGMFIESPVPNPTAMFRRDVLERLGGYRDVDWPEDYDLFLRADAGGIRMAKPAEILLHWRDHPNRLTRTDVRYDREKFQCAKAHYLAQGRLPERELLIWGAGPTGRRLFDLLAAEGVEVTGFIEVHPRRIGGTKRGQPVWPVTAALRDEVFVLVAVGARHARAEIHAYLERHGRIDGSDYLFTA
jgi:glycosyltransferase involved in cell wall biosynthesis